MLQQQVCQRLLALLSCRQLLLILACIIIINIIMVLGCRICCTLLATSPRKTSPTLQQLLQVVSDHSPPRRLFSTGRERERERERERGIHEKIVVGFAFFFMGEEEKSLFHFFCCSRRSNRREQKRTEVGLGDNKLNRKKKEKNC